MARDSAPLSSASLLQAADEEGQSRVEASLPEIGRQFGGKHHTTVLHSINKIEELRRSDKDLNRTITRLMDALQ